MSKASDKAYEQIRGMILSGELRPGAPLREEALADKCGVSRTPIREALRQLAAELLITKTESQRSFVSDWSLDEVRDTFELRAVVEGLAARRAAERITPELLSKMRTANARLQRANDRSAPDTTEFLEANREFHNLIVEAAASPRLAVLLAAVIEQPIVWRTAQHYGSDELQRSHDEHAELLSAFERRDGRWAQEIMGAHIRRAYHAYADAHAALSSSERPTDAREGGG